MNMSSCLWRKLEVNFDEIDSSEIFSRDFGGNKCARIPLDEDEEDFPFNNEEEEEENESVVVVVDDEGGSIVLLHDHREDRQFLHFVSVIFKNEKSKFRILECVKVLKKSEISFFWFFRNFNQSGEKFRNFLFFRCLFLGIFAILEQL